MYAVLEAVAGSPVPLVGVAEKQAVDAERIFISRHKGVETSVDAKAEFVSYFDKCTEIVPVGSPVAAAPFAVHNSSEPLDLMPGFGLVEHISASRAYVHDDISEPGLLGKSKVPSDIFL